MEGKENPYSHRVRRGLATGQKFPPVAYGLEGIMAIFGVSKATASRYANNQIKEAVTKNGNVMIIDVQEALRLFGVRNPARFILSD